VSRNISATARDAIFAQETNQVFLVLLEISHASLAEPIRVVNNWESIISGGDTYEASSFTFTPPILEDDKITPAQLKLDNVDRRLTIASRSISTPADAVAKVVLASDPDTVEVGPFTLKLSNISYNKQTITGDLLFESSIGYNVGTIVMDNISFPGLNEWT